jgi:hypothetical protein
MGGVETSFQGLSNDVRVFGAENSCMLIFCKSEKRRDAFLNMGCV